MDLTPQFDGNDIDNNYEVWTLSIEDKIFEILKYAGEQFVNAARTLRTYKDDTGNLRSSIGFVIALDGRIKMEDINGDAIGVAAAKETVREVLSDNDNGFVLIGVAGMQYAGFVESRGFDVISGNALEAQNILQRLVNEVLR